MIVHPPAAPIQNARAFIEARYSDPTVPTLVHHRGSFRSYNGTVWEEVEDGRLPAELYEHFGDAQYINAKGSTAPFNPTKAKVTDLLHALAAAAHLSGAVNPPAWLGVQGELPRADLSASEMVVCQNGILHVPTRTLLPLTPRFYAHHAVPFAYDAHAPSPVQWLAFLDSIWGDDQQAIETLQDIFGYLLSADTSLQKIFLIVGPKRSGKGTIARVLTALVGPHHVNGPTLASLATNFGLAPLLNTSVAIIADARLQRSDATVTERLLSISGEDSLTVDRKYRDAFFGPIPARFVILTNELPQLTDSSGALAGRFVTLTMRKSFYGRENPALTRELTAELPGIFGWALDGLERLKARGYFVEPESSADTMRELEDLGSPIGAFLRECATVGVGLSVEADDLWTSWKWWCEAHGRDNPGRREWFFRDLRAAVPGLGTRRPRKGDARPVVYEGITLGSEPDGSLRDTQEHAFTNYRDGGGEVDSQQNNALVRVPARSTPNLCCDCRSPLPGGWVRCDSCAKARVAVTP